MVSLAFQQTVGLLPRRACFPNLSRARDLVCATSSTSGTHRGAWDLKPLSSIPQRTSTYGRRQSYNQDKHGSEPRSEPRSERYTNRIRRVRVENRRSADGADSDMHVDENDSRGDNETVRPYSRRFTNREYHFGGRDRYVSNPNASAEVSAVRSALDAINDDLVYGISPVLHALKSQRRKRFERVFVQQKTINGSSGGPSRKADNDVAFAEIQQLVNDLNIPVISVPKGELNLLSKNRPHQGVVLQSAKLDFKTLSMLPKTSQEQTTSDRRAQPCYVVLDEVTDPQNAGAIMRTAYFLGASGVIVCTRNSCNLSPVVSKASAGSMELMEVLGVSSMPKFLRAAVQDGWRVVGMARDKDAVCVKDLVLDQPTLVVLGSEGSGLRTLVKQACTILVEINGCTQDNQIDSLNVSVAGAVALHQLLG